MLRVNEFIQFLKDVISICKNNDAAKLKIDTRLMPLEENVNSLEGIFKKERGSDLTKEITELDERRDQAFVSFTQFIEAYMNHFDSTKFEAAEKINRVIEKYGYSIARLNYQAETTTLTNLVNDLESEPDLAVAVNTLDLQPLIDEIKTANTLFNEKYLERIREKAQVAEGNTIELRKESEIAFRKLIDLIEAWIEVSGADSYQNLVNQLNELIEKYNQTLSLRSGDEETESEEDPELT
jgi:hypothetical protein